MSGGKVGIQFWYTATLIPVKFAAHGYLAETRGHLRAFRIESWKDFDQMYLCASFENIISFYDAFRLPPLA